MEDYLSPNCSSPAVDKFPSDGLTRDQRQSGWIALHLLIAVYCFWILATICHDYLIPCIRQMCESFKLDANVIAATVMAAIVSSPELFMNFVGTFVTGGEIGVSTIVGSALFNVLVVPACCSLFLPAIRQEYDLNWRPLTRDCICYALAILCLIVVIFDGRIFWYESLTLVLVYFTYLFFMYHHHKLVLRSPLPLGEKLPPRNPYKQVTEFTPLILKRDLKTQRSLSKLSQYSLAYEVMPSIDLELILDKSNETEEVLKSPWQRGNRNWLLFILKWPINLLLWLTIPDPRRRSYYKYLTFLMTLIWIAGVTYLTAFVITVIGDTFYVPDAVMGLTVLAIGMSAAEAVSSILVTRQGFPAMGLSNCLGSNIFSILLSLGLPWFLKAVIATEKQHEYLVQLTTPSLLYTAYLLLISLIAFHSILAMCHFRLDLKVGIACFVMYFFLISVAITLELNVFSVNDLPFCRN